MRKKKKTLAYIIVLIFMLLGIGYAYLTTTLSINGVTDVDSNTWDVYWDNVQVTTGSVSGSQVTQAPTIDTTTKTTVSYHIRLAEPGEFYEFTVDAKNDGTIDAMIDSISSKLNGVEITTLPAYLKYEITYKYTLPVQPNQMIKAGTKETYKIRIEYRNDIDPDDLPSTAQSLSLTLGVNYIQSDTNGLVVEDELYYMGYTGFDWGDPISLTSGVYTNYQDAINAFGYPLFVKIGVSNDLVSSSYAGMIINDQPLLLKAGGATNFPEDDWGWYYHNDSIYYESNKTILMNAFGISNCNEYDDSNTTYYSCNLNNTGARITKNGFVEVITTPGDSYICEAFPNNSTKCWIYHYN